jgi:hypothetical protein
MGVKRTVPFQAKLEEKKFQHLDLLPNEVLAEKLQNMPEVLEPLCCHHLTSYKGGGRMGRWVTV